jgi:hypothetical protein
VIDGLKRPVGSMGLLISTPELTSGRSKGNETSPFINAWVEVPRLNLTPRGVHEGCGAGGRSGRDTKQRA